MTTLRRCWFNAWAQPSAPSWLTWPWCWVHGSNAGSRTATELRLWLCFSWCRPLLAAQMQVADQRSAVVDGDSRRRGCCSWWGVSLPALLLRSAWMLLAALLALVLFLVPRVAPLWTSDLGPRRGVVTGISPRWIRWGSADWPAVMPLPRASRWRLGRNCPATPIGVPVHGEFDGRRWSHQIHRPRPVCRSRLQKRRVSFQWCIEPSRLRAVPWDGLAQPTALDQSITRDGSCSEHGVVATLSPTPVGRGVRCGSRLAAAATETPRSLVANGAAASPSGAWRVQPHPPRPDRLAAAEAWFLTSLPLHPGARAHG